MAWKLIPLFLFYYYEFKVITVRNNTLTRGNKSDALCLRFYADRILSL